jgi:hypothetical protein
VAVVAGLAALGGRPRQAEAQGARAKSATEAPDGTTVIALDAGDLVIDLGASRGVKDGMRVELWRPLRLKHPVTGQVLVDRFRIGTVRLVQVQTTLSLGRTEGELTRAPAVGDVVVVPDTRPAPAPVSPPVSPTAPAPPAPTGQPAPRDAPLDTEMGATVAVPTPASPKGPNAGPNIIVEDPDGRALGDLVTSLRGRTPTERAAAYTSFLQKHAKSRFAVALTEEIDSLRALAKEEAPLERSEPAMLRLRPGSPQAYAIELDARFHGAVVHVRRRGATSYRSLPMKSLGPRYWGATLPGDAVEEPGMEYFAEGVLANGRAVAIIGNASEPRDAVVDPRPIPGKDPETVAQASLASEYASFNTKKANDWVFQTEGAFAWRLRDEGIRAVRSGFGVLRGKGGSLRDLDELGRDPTDVGLTYGYLELEVAPAVSYALIGRPILGLRDNGVTGGAQGFVRIGHDLRTNLLLGGEVLGGVGLRGIVQLDWRTIRRVPVTLRTEVTNQPAGVRGDVGARAIAQVGYEVLDGLVLAARASYQGRTINHAGPGAGLAASYQW